MNTERLLVLARFLHTLPTQNLDMGSWVAWDTPDTAPIPKKGTDCGTVCCAVGWASFIPELKDQGLKIVHGDPCYGSHSGWGAVHSFFGITADQAYQLFSQSAYRKPPNPSVVRGRIYALVREHNRASA